MIFGGTNHDPSCPENGSNVNAGNFAPRLGFAYRLTADGKTSLRGGAGFYYSPPATAGYTNFVDNAPFSPQLGFNDVDFADPFGSKDTPNPFPAQYAPSIPGPDSMFVLPTTILLAFQTDYRLPSLATWNLTVERQVGQNWLFRAPTSETGVHTCTVATSKDTRRRILPSTFPETQRKTTPIRGGLTSASVVSGFWARTTTPITMLFN